MKISLRMLEYYMKELTNRIIIVYGFPLDNVKDYPENFFSELSSTLDFFNDKIYFKIGLEYILQNKTIDCIFLSELGSYDWTQEEIRDLISEILFRIFKVDYSNQQNNNVEVFLTEETLFEWRKFNPPLSNK